MKSIGIIGGMGPFATADLFAKIVLMTDAKDDNGHIHVYIDSNTGIPDRTAAILHGGSDPRPELISSAKKLECMGADFLIISCNTAHYYCSDLRNSVSIPIMSMIEETVKEAKRQGIKTAGLLATDGTLGSGVYTEQLKEGGIAVVEPAGEMQRHVMELIYQGVKAGNSRYDINGFLKVLDELESRGAETLILGCTELPIAFSRYNIHRSVIDPTIVLAKSAILFSGKSIRDDFERNFGNPGWLLCDIKLDKGKHG
jgi:aspartate racemase